MRQIHRTCETKTLAESWARARQLAPSTLSHRTSRSSAWPERCASGRVTSRSAIGFTP